MKKLLRSVFTLSYLPKINLNSETSDENKTSTLLNSPHPDEATQINETDDQQSVLSNFNEDLNLDKMLRPMEEFSLIDYYLSGNVGNVQFHKLSPIPEETEDDLAKWNESAKFYKNPTRTEMQEEEIHENSISSIYRGSNRFFMQGISSPIRHAPAMVKMLKEMTIYTVSKELNEEKNSKSRKRLKRRELQRYI